MDERDIIAMNKDAQSEYWAKQKVLVIHEDDLDGQTQTIIGAATSIKSAEQFLKEHYGEFKEISFTSFEDPSLVYAKVLEIDDIFDTSYRVKIWLEWVILSTEG